MPTSPSSRPRALLITLGDPSGIGPEVLLQALAHLPPSFIPITVIGDIRWLKELARSLRVSLHWQRYRWLDVPNLPQPLGRGRVSPAAGRAAYEYLVVAAQELRKNRRLALITAPVSKEAIVRAGIRWVGHTEFLGETFNAQPVMMFVTGKFRVSLVTTHLSIRELPKRLTRAGVHKTVRITLKALTRDFGIRHPRVALAALNPHGGEGTLFGKEEKTILKPVVQAFRGKIQGPFPVDSLVRQVTRGQYDAWVALYHDQALIPIKLLGWEKAVNVTLGLPFVRTSPVHGTAFDLVGTRGADYHSMICAIQLAAQLSHS